MIRFHHAGFSSHRPHARCRAPSVASGFTLLELSVVLALISLITIMAMTSGIAVVATARQNATVQKMAAIDKALMAFRTSYDRIPCPSDLTLNSSSSNYGLEAGSPTTSTNISNQSSGGVWYTCINGANGISANFYALNNNGTAVASAEGAVPTVTLGLPNDFMYDGWGNHIRYAVDTNMTQTGAFTAMPVGALCGPITVCDVSGPSDFGGLLKLPNNGACIDVPLSTGAMYALVSHGANGYGAYTQNGTATAAQSDNINEHVNCHDTGTLHGGLGTCPAAVSGTPKQFTTLYVEQSPGYGVPNNPLYYFDDIVTFKERWQMQVPWDKQGSTCPYIYAINYPSNITQLDLNGNVLATNLGSGNIPALGGSSPTFWGLSTDSSGNIWFGDLTDALIHAISSAGNWVATIGGTVPTYSGDDHRNCSGLATSATTATSIPGLYYNNSGTITTGYCGQDQSSCTCSATTKQGGFGHMWAPYGVAVDPKGNVWVTDTINNRIQEFSSNGAYLMTLGPTYTDGSLRAPPTSNPGTCSSASCPTGTGNGEFNQPAGITSDPYGNIWVVDTSNNRVQKFSSTGQWLQTIGGGGTCTGCVSYSSCTCNSGSATGMFNTAAQSSIASDINGNIWVADSNNNRIQEFTNAGVYVTSISDVGVQGLAFDALGNLWAANSNNGLQKYSNINGTWTLEQTISIGGQVFSLAISR